jgi:hypothetical protein
MIEMSMPLSYHVCRAPAQRLLLAQLRQEARQRHLATRRREHMGGRGWGDGGAAASDIRPILDLKPPLTAKLLIYLARPTGYVGAH